MKAILIDEREFSSAAEVHAVLKRELGFPSYYGGNLAALDDCLGDICTPVRIDLHCCEPASEWFARICTVIMRAATQNEMIESRMLSAGDDSLLLHEVLRKLDSLEGPDQLVATSAAQEASPSVDGRETAKNLATGSDGDRFECGACGCRISDLLEESRMLIEGIPYCPNCGREISNPGGSESMKWVSELI